jgi:nicotinamide-nucleotide amidase
MKKVFATLITIGDELLIGQVVDTNSAWMAQQLNTIGVLVKQRLSVGDNAADIRHALDEGFRQSDIILITGGLGPTADDITKPTLCDYFGGRLVMHEPTLQHVKSIFARLNRPMVERNVRQAEVPDTCTVVHNARGTAPGMWFEKDGRIFVSMPGVPFEMKGMMADGVLPKLKTAFQLPHIIHRTLPTTGIGESFLADQIQSWEEALPENMKLAYLPNYGMVRLRITAIGEEREQLANETAQEFEKLKVLVQAWLVTDEDEPMEKVLGRLLLSRGKTMATAESCTGGNIARLITTHTGSSAWFMGSVVSYTNAVKQELLGVPAEVLATHGAVSQPVVEQMVSGVLAATGADFALAVSGIMGPDGGTPEKPVGTVWMAAGNAERQVSKMVYYRFDRQRNIDLTTIGALDLLRRFILEEE